MSKQPVLYRTFSACFGGVAVRDGDQVRFLRSVTVGFDQVRSSSPSERLLTGKVKKITRIADVRCYRRYLHHVLTAALFRLFD
jgi:hypothetical protein